MYAPETILALKESKSKGTPGEDDYEPFAYDEVRVVGSSPVNHALRSAEWTGSNGQGVIITPLTSFGSTLDEPYGKLVKLYDVKELPEERVVYRETPVRVINSASAEAGRTPEEVFAEEAPASEASQNGRRVRTPITESPLPQVEGEETGGSPLGE
jgi:hypothetical protein